MIKTESSRLITNLCEYNNNKEQNIHKSLLLRFGVKLFNCLNIIYMCVVDIYM